ncbi:glycosyltransferase family 2 protein [Humibacter ginsenosidimutans]|uniref:Glycosyltransferase family 2 protein n=1 Tax=Humibacter ginsenosidimutans TaxID=2599293 RepID=A0A5B8M0X8_9MICO|nr:glycosyltransferase family 2 protein [Humibacter ginsenosidimutans]QDZ13475.1 glycosyltransferase family 2 protein [Humibacter ginsenosidimutans]
MSTISVVIPSYNDAPMLRECLDRLTTQLRRADEIIVVDNASTDDTADVARSFGARVIVQPVRGIFPAASAGYDAASSDIIARLDADSRPPADWLAHIEAELTVAQEVGVLTGPGEFYDGNPLITWLGENLYLGGYFWFGSLWLDNGPIFGSNFAMRREVWRRVRGSVHSGTRRVHDDLDLSLNLPPDVIVQVDDTLRVGISARPFSTWRGFGRRLGWAFLTFRLNWPQASPWRIRDERERYLRERHADDGNATSTV